MLLWEVMLYSLRKYRFLWALRRKKLIVLALQILMWMLKISLWMFLQEGSATCLPGEPLLGNVAAAGGLAGKRAVPRQELTDRGALFPPPQRHLYAGHLSWMTVNRAWRKPGVCRGRPSTIDTSLQRQTPLPEVTSSSALCPNANTGQKKMSRRERRWSLFPGWGSRLCFLFHFRKTTGNLDE